MAADQEELRGRIMAMGHEQYSELKNMMLVHPDIWRALQHEIDPFNIIAQRKALKHAGISTQVDRGHEWWMDI